MAFTKDKKSVNCLTLSGRESVKDRAAMDLKLSDYLHVGTYNKGETDERKL